MESDNNEAVITKRTSSGNLEYIIKKDKENTFGRSSSCDMTINDPYVSRIHVIIIYQDGIYQMKNNKSKNETYLNKKEIKPDIYFPLNNGDFIGLGNNISLFFNIRPKTN